MNKRETISLKWEELGITPQMAFGMTALEIWLFLSENAPWLLPGSKPVLPVIQF